ncbi:MAG: GPP34 family phosphoprotein, partial [Eubacterium sp.]
MNELSVAQEYLLCTLNEKGRLPSLNSEAPVCVVAGALLELMAEGCVVLENKKVCVEKPLPEKLFYLKTFYDYLNEKPRNLAKIAEEYNFTFTDKRL